MSVMPPQHQVLKRDPSGEYSVGRYDELQSADSFVPLSSINNSSEEEPCRAAEAWLSRGGAMTSIVVSSESLESLHWSQGGGGGGISATTSSEAHSSLSSSGRTSLRERLQRRILRDNKEETTKALLDARLRLRDLHMHTAAANHHIPPPPPPPTATPQCTPNSPKLRKTQNHQSDLLLNSYRHLLGQHPDNNNCHGQNDTSQRNPASKHSPPTEQEVVQMMQALQTTPSELSLSNHYHNDHHENEAKQQRAAVAAASHASFMRLSRQVRYSRRGVANTKKENSIKLHIYDLLPQETIVTLGWGFECPIGQCFNAMNDGLHALGTGAYHCGIEVNGIEYAYGANNSEGTTGVFSCIPMRSPGFEYRTSLDFGSRPLTRTAWVRVETQDKVRSGTYREIVTYIEGREVMKEMAREYLGPDYDLLRRNCCTFARDACLRLGISQEEIPSWFLNLADAGAAGQDVALMALQPITSMLSVANDTEDEDDDSILESPAHDAAEVETGFEVIAKGKEGSHQKTEMEIVRVCVAVGIKHQPGAGENGCDGTSDGLGVRRTLSWTC